jgi:hydrogenase maturation protease
MSAAEPRAIVVGVGQPTAGDDGVGLLVARALARRGRRAIESTDATVILTYLAQGDWVVVVDAVLGEGSAGTVVVLRPEALEGGPSPVSSHGLGVREVLVLASTLYGPDALRRVDIVGVMIEGGRRGEDLTPDVAAAVEPAARVAEHISKKRDLGSRVCSEETRSCSIACGLGSRRARRRSRVRGSS